MTSGPAGQTVTVNRLKYIYFFFTKKKISPQNKISHAVLEQLVGEQIMTEFSFLDELFFTQGQTCK